MKTAARAMIVVGLVGTACSGETGDGQPFEPGAPTPGANAPTPGAMASTPGMGTNETPGVPGVPNTAGMPSPDAVPGEPGGGEGMEATPPDTGTCQIGVPVTSQIPRLTNLQYDTVVKDIFDVVPAAGSWSASFEPD